MKQAKIEILVDLDKNHIPENIYWSANDAQINNQKTNALLMSVWDQEKQEMLKLDLWTKEMTVDHMKKFFHQVLVSLSNTYHRATNEEKGAEIINQFAEEFANKIGIK